MVMNKTDGSRSRSRSRSQSEACPDSIPEASSRTSALYDADFLKTMNDVQCLHLEMNEDAAQGWATEQVNVALKTLNPYAADIDIADKEYYIATPHDSQPLAVNATEHEGSLRERFQKNSQLNAEAGAVELAWEIQVEQYDNMVWCIPKGLGDFIMAQWATRSCNKVEYVWMWGKRYGTWKPEGYDTYISRYSISLHEGEQTNLDTLHKRKIRLVQLI